MRAFSNEIQMIHNMIMSYYYLYNQYSFNSIEYFVTSLKTINTSALQKVTTIDNQSTAKVLTLFIRKWRFAMIFSSFANDVGIFILFYKLYEES